VAWRTFSKHISDEAEPSRVGALSRITHVIAVVGCQRSGTTLTGQIVGSHPHALLVDEMDGLYSWFHADADGQAEAQGLASAMLERAAGKYSDPSPRFEACDGRMALASSITSLVLKAPNLTYDYEKLARVPVRLTAVYPVRDPRAVAFSMARLGTIDFVGNQLRLLEQRPQIASRFQSERQVMSDEAAPLWMRHAAIWRIKSGLGPQFERAGISVYQFRYEDLVSEPKIASARLLNACDLPALGDAWRPETAYLGHGPGGTDRTRPVDRASLLEWRSHYDTRQQDDILRAAGELARRFGYV
jgi:Sulfotransferase family